CYRSVPCDFSHPPFSYLAARMRKREACCGREQFPVRYNKAVRASSIRRRMELRRLVRSSAREPEGGLDWPPSNRGPSKIVSGGISGIFGFSATVGRTTFLRTICHTRLSYRCVGAGTSHPCRSRVSAASIALLRSRTGRGPWLEISRLLTVFLCQVASTNRATSVRDRL